MASLHRTNFAPTALTQQDKKEGRTMKSTLLKSLMAVATLAIVISASSLATAEDGHPEAIATSTAYQHEVRGVDHVYPFTFPDAEQKAVYGVNAWLNQNPNCHIISHTKKNEWINMNGQQRPQCTITFWFEVLP